jgi:murein DD-endopeptidase MepM/ murein hydrolase activator NlpD
MIEDDGAPHGSHDGAARIDSPGGARIDSPGARIDIARHRAARRLSRRRADLRSRLRSSARWRSLDPRAHRGRAVAGGAALVAAGLAATITAVSGTVPGPDPAPGPAAAALADRETAAALADREAAAALADREAAAARADRSARTAPTPTAEVAAPDAARDATRRAAPSKPSPEPEPEPPAWVHPLPAARVSSCYGWRFGRLHAGVDLSARYGAAIHAVGAGTVVEAGWNGGYGISVLIDHGDGVLTHYGHAGAVRVSAGEKVTAGQAIAEVGSTGNSTGPHLHFEVHEGQGNQVDPADWLRGHGVDLGGC